jgi:spore maturation protein CgeB
MRIFFVGSPSTFNTEFVASFVRTGSQVEVFDDRTNVLLPGLHYIPGSWSALRLIPPLKRFNKKKLNHILLAQCRAFKPDILITTKGNNLLGVTLATLRQEGISSVNWFPENSNQPMYHRWVTQHYREYDYFLSFDPTFIKNFPSTVTTKVGYLPFGISPAVYNQSISQEDRARYTCDVCFAGAPYPERIQILEQISRMGISLKIYGWSGWKDTPLKDFYFGPLYTTSLAKLYAVAKISLNMNVHPVDSGVNVRTFEIPAAHGFQITDNQPDLGNLFEIGKEICIFQTPEELFEKISYYLTHETERSAIVSAGRERVLRDHTLDHRARELLRFITVQEPKSMVK